MLGQLARDLTSIRLCEDNIGNADETNFIINEENGITLGLCGDENMKYVEVISEGEGMEMMVRISGGKNSRVDIPMMICKKKLVITPYEECLMTIQVFVIELLPSGGFQKTKWLNGLAIIAHYQSFQMVKSVFLFMDNCSSHSISTELEQALKSKNAELRFLPANATDLLQPVDSFVIQKLNAAWSARWERQKIIAMGKSLNGSTTVSYTHLTLPTILLV